MIASRIYMQLDLFSKILVSSSVKSISSQLKVSLKLLRNRSVASSTVTVRFSSFVNDVTRLPTKPHGTMWSNHFKSTLQFSASPCVVM